MTTTRPASDMQFYLGTPEPSWLWRSVRLPLFVSHRRLSRLARPRRATTAWALDSGGFTELSQHGGWVTTARDYIAAVARYDRLIGGMEWAAPQDWMCEPAMLELTGLTVAEHQRRTVENLLELRTMWVDYSDDTCPIMPVLQGWSADDYLACVELYAQHGVELAGEPLVGLGSVCRRQNTDDIGAVIGTVAQALPGVALHGFGVKSGGLGRYGHMLASADSQAWSLYARRCPEGRTPRCTHAGRCTWCPHYALAWRDRVLEAAGRPYDLARFPEFDQPAALAAA